ncbi:RICIN domain-containing protein [Streptomyces sp. NPDC090442]|uniref:RICIN domain-containing protein n=1 Tax=Streptomyces sp. NPDC090442 TaxID=3365962 RepID=UPI003810C5E3
MSPDSHRLVTWNMENGRDRWASVATIAQTNSVVALQEVPSVPARGVRQLRSIGNVEVYSWRIARNTYRYLYILPQASRNVGMVASFRADRVVQIGGRYRDGLGLVRQADNVLFASVHASAGRNGGGRGADGPSLVRRVAAAAATRNVTNWVALGDFNRDPGQQNLGEFPAGSRIYNSGQATQRSGGELDYMVSNIQTENWQATVQANRGSDHWPVYFGSLRAAAGPQDLTVTSSHSGLYLDVYQDGLRDGTHVVQYHGNGATNQLWGLLRNGGIDTSPLYRLISYSSQKCLDVDSGQQSRPGDALNIWTCHGRDGSPTPGGPTADTQNWTLVHPDPFRPNQTELRNRSTRLYASIDHNSKSDDATIVQRHNQPSAPPIPGEVFYLHPDPASAAADPPGGPGTPGDPGGPGTPGGPPA